MSDLSDLERQVIEECGTEPRFSSNLIDEDREGDFLCRRCGQKLFDSEVKYDSGSGWPSFWKAEEEAVGTRQDGRRTEVICSECGAHLGHVFEDGPEPTGKRYCINGVAINFKEK